jgi:hypothetical protein
MGHWLILLPSRRYAYMFIGLGCWLIAAVSMAMGETLERFYGVVSRDEEPKRFRRKCPKRNFIMGPHTFTFKLVHYHSYDGIRKNSVPVKVSAAPRAAVSHRMENCAKVNSLLGIVRVTSEQLY